MLSKQVKARIKENHRIRRIPAWKRKMYNLSNLICRAIKRQCNSTIGARGRASMVNVEQYAEKIRRRATIMRRRSAMVRQDWPEFREYLLDQRKEFYVW